MRQATKTSAPVEEADSSSGDEEEDNESGGGGGDFDDDDDNESLSDNDDISMEDGEAAESSAPSGGRRTEESSRNSSAGLEDGEGAVPDVAEPTAREGAEDDGDQLSHPFVRLKYPISAAALAAIRPGGVVVNAARLASHLGYASADEIMVGVVTKGTHAYQKTSSAHQFLLPWKLLE